MTVRPPASQSMLWRHWHLNPIAAKSIPGSVPTEPTSAYRGGRRRTRRSTAPGAGTESTPGRRHVPGWPTQLGSEQRTMSTTMGPAPRR
jgi:hypothetical protein